jgi:ATP-dependent Clp protease ATP-binding subunit ClpC
MLARPMSGRRQLRLDTVVLHRALWSGNVTVAPAAEPGLVCHGDENAALGDLRVLLSAVLSEARPVRISRHLLPTGTELRAVRVPVSRKLTASRLREPIPIAMSCVLVPQGRDHWVIVPAIGHTFYLARDEAFDEIAPAEIARVIASAATSACRSWWSATRRSARPR